MGKAINYYNIDRWSMGVPNIFSSVKKIRGSENFI